MPEITQKLKKQGFVNKGRKRNVLKKIRPGMLPVRLLEALENLLHLQRT